MDDNEFKRRVIADGVKNLFQQENVCVCDSRKVVKMANVVPPADLASWWQLHHCRSWGEIDSEMRIEIFKRTMTTFVHDRMPIDAVDICLGLSPAPVKRKRLTSTGFQPRTDGINEMFDNVVDDMAARVVRSVDERVDKIIDARLAEKTKPSFLRRLLGA